MNWRRYFYRARADQDHAQEFESHLALETDENIARGMPPAEARHRAQRKLGNLTRIREDVYDMNSIRPLETLSRDVQYAARMLRKNPAFAAIGVLTLALGLGANAAIFSLVDAVLLKPLPYPEPDRLLMVFERPPGGNRNAVAAANFLDWREDAKTLALVAVNGAWLTLTGQGEPQRVQVSQVGYDYFEVLGCPPATGRTFLPEEGRPGNDHVLLITHRYWYQHLGGDPNILGKSLMLNGDAYKIVGTLPANSWFERHWADVWMPLALSRAGASREFHTLGVYGRLRPGATRAAAKAEMDAIAARLARDYPASNKDWGVTIEPLADLVVGSRLRQSLFVLFGAVGAVMLIACVNLANLLLARSAARERELWVRISLGAGRARLVWQFLTESLLLSLLGGALGCGFGYLLLRGLVAWMPRFTLPIQADVRLDWRVLAFLFVLAVVSGLLFGMAPAIAAWRHDVASGLKEGHRGSTGGVPGRRIRSALIVAEVALSFVLVATAGVLIHSFLRLNQVDTGVNMTNVVTMQLPRAMQKDIDPARESRVMRGIRDSVAALPGVLDAAITNGMPMQGWGFGMAFEIQGRSSAGGSGRAGCGLKMVTPTYFQTLGMKLKAGRSLAETDVSGALPVTVINEAMAKRYFKGESPIGQRLLMQRIVTGKFEMGPVVPWEIVGVVSDEKTFSLDRETGPGMYVTFDQSPVVGVGLAVRAQGDPMRMMKAIQAAIWAVNKDQAITDVKLLEQIKTDSTANSRYNTLLLSGFAALALLLAAIGIYGVVAYSVAQRTRELGIRAALGASRGRLLGLALRRSLALTGLGLAIGALGIQWSGGLVSSLLFHTRPAEPETLLTVAAVLAVVAIAASLIPARRAARTDPAVALRHE
jgi:putative ABC transport system permease protein